MRRSPGGRNVISGLAVSMIVGACGFPNLPDALADGTRKESSPRAERVFGLTPPGAEPEEFWAEILTAEDYPHGQLALWPDGQGAFWSVVLHDRPEQTILSSTFDGKTFSKPVVAPFLADTGSGFPAFSVDGKRLFFSALLPPVDGSSLRPEAIFFVERDGSGWTKPAPIEPTVDARTTVGQVTVARSGNIYFSGKALSDGKQGLYVCRSVDGGYLRPERLGGPLSTERYFGDPWVDPEEKFMLFSYLPQVNPTRLADLAISLRQADGQWGRLIPLGRSVNTPAYERFPSLSRDGKYLFFIRSFSEGFVGEKARFYWVEAKILVELRRGAAG